MSLADGSLNRKLRTILGVSAALILFAGTAACLMLLLRRDGTSAAAPIAAVAEPPHPPLPTEIDADFLALVEKCLLPVSATYGYELRITSGYRTAAEQDLVFQQGRTENGHIVTEVAGGRSLHNFGLAVDVVDRWRGYDIDWERLGRIGAYCGLEQNDEGDQAHFTHRDGLSIEQLEDGFRPAPLALPCGLLAERSAAGERVTRQDLKTCGTPEF